MISAERTSSADRHEVAVLVPCYNEERTIAKVVRDFRIALPGAAIFVYDNNSSDHTIQAAKEAGATVYSVPHRGKGRVVRRMFSDIEAATYVLVDGDATYDAPSAAIMIARLVLEKLDMVVATRSNQDAMAFRPGHQTGNRLFTAFITWMFGESFTDIFSGYRVFSRRFVKSFPALSSGFEIETELTVHALELALPVGEVATPYSSRPDGSVSKLNTWRDGFRILWTVVRLFRAERPLAFFGFAGITLALIAVSIAVPLFITYLQEGLVPRLPTALLATGLMLVSFLSIAVGLILDTVTRGRREAKLIAYLTLSAPGS
jgi:glycosyltransferase involved in cell wall biosynthesis